MNILVINGSPKGKNSVTLHTILYLRKKFPEHEFCVLDAGQKIRAYEKDFSEAKTALENAGLIIFSYPVYTFLVPYQLHRFIELIKENDVNIKGKHVTQFSTSMHFYDVTAHEFIKENCFDLQMKYIDGLSAGMDDLTEEKGQKEAVSFFKRLIWSCENEVFETGPVKSALKESIKIEMPERVTEKADKEVVVITDAAPEDTGLKAMIERFDRVLPYKVKVVNIAEYEFKGGCLGCLNCAVNGKCVYKDGFDDYLRTNIQSAAAMITAFTIKDHSMGSRFKLYDDRQFCNGHRTVTSGMPHGYLICGDLESEKNLRMVIDARAQVGGNYLVGTVCDTKDPAQEIDKMAKKLEYAIENGYSQTANFYGVGGMKIFRDLIWLMQGIMKADHEYYKSHGYYDFPQQQRGKMIKMKFLGKLISNPKVKEKMGDVMSEGMIMPYKKVLEKE